MGATIGFITLLRDQPLIGFLIGLGFAAVMFGSKNLIVYLYSRRQATRQDTE